MHVWGLYQQNVGINQIQASGYVMCWAAKWYGEKDIRFSSIKKAGAEKMLTAIHKLVDAADVVVHFNGTRFDMPTLNKEFITYKMKPPAPYKQVDLYRTARDQFRFPSNKLDYISQALGLGKKVRHTGHELWTRCMANDATAWREMEAYNRHDVVLLEKLYDKMRPWIKTHPNHGLYTEADDTKPAACTNCGGTRLNRRGYARTVANVYARFQCNSCGSWLRGGKPVNTKKDRANLVRRAT